MADESPTHIHGHMHSKKKKSLFKNKWCWIGSVSFILLLIGAAAILWFVKNHPKKYSNHTTSKNNAQIQLDSLSLSQYKPSPSTSLLTATWDVQFSVRNPSTATAVYYQTVQVAVTYGTELLSTAKVPPYRVQGSEWNPKQATAAAQGVQMKNESTMAAMEAERGQGTLTFDVGVYAGYWLGGSEVNGKYWAVDVTCYGVKVALQSKNGGKSSGGPVPCKIIRTW